MNKQGITASQWPFKKWAHNFLTLRCQALGVGPQGRPHAEPTAPPRWEAKKYRTHVFDLGFPNTANSNIPLNFLLLISTRCLLLFIPLHLSGNMSPKKDKLFFAPFLAATETNDAPIGYGNTSSS